MCRLPFHTPVLKGTEKWLTCVLSRHAFCDEARISAGQNKERMGWGYSRRNWFWTGGRISQEPNWENEGEGATSLEIFRLSICPSERLTPSCGEGGGGEDFLKLLGWSCCQSGCLLYSSGKCLTRAVKLIVKLEWLGKQIASWWGISDCVQGWCHLPCCSLVGWGWGGRCAGLTHVLMSLDQLQKALAPLRSPHLPLWGSSQPASLCFCLLSPIPVNPGA